MKNPDDRHEDIMLAAALQYAERGWRVFPNHKPTLHENGSVTCSCGSSECDLKQRGKHPRLGAWQKQATTKPSQIRSWWKKYPETNIGIATGWESDLIVLDVDVGQGLGHLQEWERQGKFLPTTVTAQTGSGGLQHYFVYPDLDFDPKTKTRLCGFVDIDVRANGGQVVAPPSLHPSGNHYRWVDGHSPDDVAVAAPPDWLIEMLRQDGRPLTKPRSPRLPVFDELPPPQAHIDFLHPYLNPRLVTTATGELRRGLDGSLRRRWQEDPDEFAVERRLIAAIGNLWLPPEVRPWLDDDGVTLMAPDHSALDYYTLKPGHRCPQEIAGGRWINDGKHNRKSSPLTSLPLMFRLLLGQLRLLVPWDEQVNSRGYRRKRMELDTLLVPAKIWAGPREPVDLWAAEPDERRRLLQPVVSALEAVVGRCAEPPCVSYWAEGESEFWIAIHAHERLPVDELLSLQQGIIDMAAEHAPEVRFFGERLCTHGSDAPVLMYEIGLGNVGDTPCPLPFSFHPDHPERMMMALDPNSGEFHDDQVGFLLSLQRRSSLGALLSTFSEVQTPSVRAAAARRRVVGELDALHALFGQEHQSEGSGSHTSGTEHSADNAPRPQAHTDNATDQLGRQGWRSRLPENVSGLYSTMIDSGALARVLAVMRDDGLLEDAAVGQGVLQELEEEVVSRYTGSAMEAHLRGELRGYITCALASIDALFDAAIRLSAPRTQQVQKLAQTLYELLPTRGSGRRPSAEEIAALLECIAVKSQGQRQAQWTLDFVAIKAGWAAEVCDGTSRISAANRQRISRFMRRICQDYYRDPSGDVSEDEPPLLRLIRCDRKGRQGVPSLYTFLWENWGEAFGDLCDKPCPLPPGKSISDRELMELDCVVRRRRQNQ